MKRITQIVAFCLLTVTHLAAQKNYVSEVWVSDLGNGKYKNPVLYADYSDPDACRVGEDFYMTSSSFNCLPGLQILHSKDLVNWTIVGAATKAKISFDKGVQCILNCQVTENGVKTFWGAQHDEHTLLPAVARPKELPSYSGSEGTRILQFLMELENPSQEIKDAVVAAAEWLEKVKIPNKKVVNVTENGILVDRKVIDSPGDDMWGRFIQIGGKVG